MHNLQKISVSQYYVIVLYHDERVIGKMAQDENSFKAWSGRSFDIIEIKENFLALSFDVISKFQFVLDRIWVAHHQP